MVIEDFGARVASVWEGLRSTTRRLIVGALQSPSATAAAATTSARGASVSYDARADWELSRLLAALDERAAETGGALNAEQSERLRHMAETCAFVLQNQTRSAEVFAQLIERAAARRDYARIDALADILSARFAPSEICELVRSRVPLVRALADEALAQAPIAALVSLLGDPLDAEIARAALERQATEYESEEARQLVNLLDQTDIGDDM